MADDDSADQYGHVWTEATRPGDSDRPPGAVHDRIVTWEIGQTSGFEKLMRGPYRMMGGADLYWSLTFTLWRYTPRLSSGAPGKPLKVLHVRMDPNTILHAPVTWPEGVPEGSPDPGPLPPEACMAGAFVESINVRMGFEDPRALLTDPGMDTDAQHGSVSTSTSYQFSGGFFGMTGTGSASATFTHSATVELTDFVVTSKSTTAQTNDTIAMWSDGNRYVAGPPTPGTPPPDRAVSDTRLAMQGIWELDGSISDDLVFDVEIDVTYAVGGDYSNGWGVRARQYGLEQSWDPWTVTYRQTVSWVRKVTVPLSVVDK